MSMSNRMGYLCSWRLISIFLIIAVEGVVCRFDDPVAEHSLFSRAQAVGVVDFSGLEPSPCVSLALEHRSIPYKIQISIPAWV